jgi:protein-S-isoprenylcysteine O-methyltransferase Ste14
MDEPGATRRPGRLTGVQAGMTLWALVVYSTWFFGPFVLAGTWSWGPGWAAWGAQALLLLLHRRYVARWNPELLRQRQRLGPGTPAWDVAWNLLFWPLLAMEWMVAGLGVGLGRPQLPAGLWPAGLALFASGLAVSARAMAVNPHFEGTVRIQRERDHRVIDVGPYRLLRHPGYLGLALWALATPLLLLSADAFVPAGVVVGWLVLRTALEDRLLRRELEGYEAYARRVRYRLVPGLW